MYEDRRTILPSGLLSTAGKPSYNPKPIKFSLPNASKPAANWINRDKAKAESDARYREQQRQQEEANSKGGSVICTELKRLGIMSPELYEHAHLGRPVNQQVLNGYHLWAVPYVEAMRRWPLPRIIAKPLALAWARQRAHKQAPQLYPYGSPLGLAVHIVGGAICWTIGLFIPKTVEWQSLYTGKNEGYPWPTR